MAMTEDEFFAVQRHLASLNEFRKQMHSLFGALDSVPPVLDFVVGVDARVKEAEHTMAESRAQVERDRILIEQRQPDLEKARAMQGTVRDLSKQIEELTTRRDHIQSEIAALHRLVMGAAH